MAKESDRDQDRVEEAFANLSAEPGQVGGGEGAGVWKVATLLLLVLALALPMAIGIRASRRAEEEQSRLDAAQARVAAAEREAEASLAFVEERDLVRATQALGHVIHRLADIPVTARVVDVIRAELAQNETDLLRLREDQGRKRSIISAQMKALEALLDGDTDAAAVLLPAGAQTDPVSRSLLVLTRRLARWNLAAAETAGRSSALDILAKDWGLTALIADRDRAQEEERATYRVREKVREAYAALSAEDFADARRAVWNAFDIRGLGGAEQLLADLDRQQLRVRAKELFEAGKLADAEACYRLLADVHSDAAARKQADQIGGGRATLASDVALKKLWTDSVAAGDDLRAAVLEAVLRERTERGHADPQESEHWLRWLTARAYEEYRERNLTAARAWVKGAADWGHTPARELLATIEEDLAKERSKTALASAEEVLDIGGVGYATILFLRAGEVPKELLERYDEAERREAIERAADRILLGDGKEALEIFRKCDLLQNERAATHVARARFLVGEIQAGLDLLPDDPGVRAFELVRVAVLLPQEDRKGFAALVGKALEIAGPRPDLQAVFAVALEESGKPKEAMPHWSAVRDVALARAPLEKSPSKEETPPEKDEPPAPEEE